MSRWCVCATVAPRPTPPAGCWAGSTCPSTSSGRAQAEALAAAVGPVDRVVTSPLLRDPPDGGRPSTRPSRSTIASSSSTTATTTGCRWPTCPPSSGGSGGRIPSWALPGGESLAALRRPGGGRRLDELIEPAGRRDRRGGGPRVADQGRGHLGARRGRRGDLAAVRAARRRSRASTSPSGGPILHSFNEVAHLGDAGRMPASDWPVERLADADRRGDRWTSPRRSTGARRGDPGRIVRSEEGTVRPGCSGPPRRIGLVWTPVVPSLQHPLTRATAPGGPALSEMSRPAHENESVGPARRVRASTRDGAASLTGS